MNIKKPSMTTMTDPKTIHPYPILVVPDPRLKEIADPVDDINDDIRHVLDRMVVTMRQEDGLGLAATQVGLKKRLIVMDIPSEEEHDHSDGGDCEHCQLYKLVNPVIVHHSDTKKTSQEGCLSIPGQYVEVQRFESITLEYHDETGVKKTLKATGLLSDCIQHEIDHLNGILAIDYVSGLKRKILVQKARKVASLIAKRKSSQ